jgi:hypothetical protein
MLLPLNQNCSMIIALPKGVVDAGVLLQFEVWRHGLCRNTMFKCKEEQNKTNGSDGLLL